MRWMMATWVALAVGASGCADLDEATSDSGNGDAGGTESSSTAATSTAPDGGGPGGMDGGGTSTTGTPPPADTSGDPPVGSTSGVGATDDGTTTTGDPPAGSTDTGMMGGSTGGDMTTGGDGKDFEACGMLDGNACNQSPDCQYYDRAQLCVPNDPAEYCVFLIFGVCQLAGCNWTGLACEPP